MKLNRLFKSAIVSCALSLLLAQNSFGATSKVITYAYASASVTSAAYVTLSASTPASTSYVQVCDTSGQLVKIAVGSAGNEVDIVTTPINGCSVVPYYISAGSRLSAKSISVTASTGFNAIGLVP